MTLDTQLRTRLTAAVDDTAVPPGLAHAALSGGRRRRCRRTAVAVVVATAAVTGGLLLTPVLNQPSADSQIASGGGQANQTAFRWARSLPEGAEPGLPYFAYGVLWSAGEWVTLPATVNQTVGPWAVSGGWIVAVGESEHDRAWAVLSPDGSLRNLPPETYEHGLGMARFEVSPDGRQAATEGWLVDVVAMTATELPHAPATQADGDYVNAIGPKSFTEQGLVYEAGPYTAGVGTTYLLRPDGSTVRADLPDDAHIPDASPGDIAVDFDNAADNSDTCVTSHRLVDGQWIEDGTGCMGKSLGEAHSISPDGRWLITDDLPRVWDLQAGRFAMIDIPREVVTKRGLGLVGGIVWETDDSFLLPVADRIGAEGGTTWDFDQFVQVVRCTMSTGACERAGVDVENRVVGDVMASTEFRFAAS